MADEILEVSNDIGEFPVGVVEQKDVGGDGTGGDAVDAGAVGRFEEIAEAFVAAQSDDLETGASGDSVVA